jgi:hypothetical protein
VWSRGAPRALRPALESSLPFSGGLADPLHARQHRVTRSRYSVQLPRSRTPAHAGMTVSYAARFRSVAVDSRDDRLGTVAANLARNTYPYSRCLSASVWPYPLALHIRCQRRRTSASYPQRERLKHCSVAPFARPEERYEPPPIQYGLSRRGLSPISSSRASNFSGKPGRLMRMAPKCRPR